MKEGPRKAERVVRKQNAALRDALNAALAGAALLAGTPGTPHADTISGLNTAKKNLEDVHEKTQSTIQAAVRPENLDDSIRDLETKLSPGGSFARKLENPTTSIEEVDWILRYVNKVVEHLKEMSIMPQQYVGQTEAGIRTVPPLENFRGTVPMTLIAIDAEGKEKKRICSGSYMALGGASYFVTARHCIEGTTIEKQFTTLPYEEGDIAVRYEPEYQGPAISLNESYTDRDLQGKMAAIQGTKNGKPFTRVSFLIKMSEPLFQKLIGDAKAQASWLPPLMAKSFMLPLLPGDATLGADRSAPPLGMSGSRVSPWIDGAFRAGPPFFGANMLEYEDATGSRGIEKRDQKGINSPMGFVASLDAMKKACARAREEHENARRPHEGAPDGWIARITDEH